MLDLFTIVWGEMTEMYLDYTLNALLWEGNIPATKKQIHNYTFYASDQAKVAITAHKRYEELEELLPIIWEEVIGGAVTNTSLKHQLAVSCDDKHYIINLNPDTVVGNGSLYNIAQIASEGTNPILYGFTRTTEEGWGVLGEMVKQPLSNRELVSLSMQYLSSESRYAIEREDKHWIVSHDVPTPCLLPDKWLVEAFATNQTWNSGFDHAVPYMMVEKGYPWRFIEHSDIYFQVERSKHLLIDKGIPWMQGAAVKGVFFFRQQKEIWQGNE